MWNKRLQDGRYMSVQLVPKSPQACPPTVGGGGGYDPRCVGPQQYDTHTPKDHRCTGQLEISNFFPKSGPDTEPALHNFWMSPALSPACISWPSIEPGNLPL